MIDASMALAWLIERQRPADQQRANHLLEACGESPWWVPCLWHLEVRNALLVAERHSVLKQPASDLLLARLSSLPFLTESDRSPERSTRILSLARAHELFSYDATYLELAQRPGASLASFDRALNHAAAEVDVPLVEAP